MQYSTASNYWECRQGHKLCVPKHTDEEDQERPTQTVSVDIPYEPKKETEKSRYQQRVENALKKRKAFLESHLLTEHDIIVREDKTEYFTLPGIEGEPTHHEVPQNLTRYKVFGQSGQLQSWPTGKRPSSSA